MSESTSPDTSTSSDPFEFAESLYQQGSFAEAETALTVLLTHSPDHFLAHIRLGFCARHRNDRAAAAAYFELASRVDPSHIGVRLEMATDLLELGRLEEAEAGFRAVLDIAPQEAWAHIGVGHCARRRGDRLASLASFLAAASHDPGNIWAKPEAAADLRELNRLDEAQALYNEVLISQPENFIARIGLAKCARQNGDFTVSLKHYEKALKTKPENVEIQFEIAELHFKLGSFAEAETALNVLLTHSPDHFLAHIRLGFCARHRNDRAAAAAYFEHASRIDSSHVGVRLEMATDLLELGQLEEAEAGFRAVLNIAPEEASAHIGIGHCARRRGDRSASLASFLAAAGHDPGNVWAKPEAAADLLELNRLDEAKVLYNEVLISQPENLNALIGLVHCARRKGDSITSRALLNRAITIDANNAAVLLEIANEQREAGEWQDAKATLQAILDRDAQNLYALIILGLVFRAVGEYQNALTFFVRAHEFYPDNAQLLVEMAIEERRLGRQETCDRLLAQALDLDTGCTDAIIQSAEQAMMAHDAIYALQLYQNGLERKPLQLGLLLGAARTLTNLGKIDDALQLLASAKSKLGMQPDIESTKVSLLRQIGDWHNAMTLIRQARVSWPWHLGLWIEHAYHELSMGSDQEVRACLDSCPADSINGLSKLKQLEGLFAERRCAFNEAFEFYNAAAALNVNDPGIYADLTRLSLKTLRIDSARDYLRQFCTLNAPTTKLQGKSTNISQTIFGQWLDEYALNRDEIERVGVLLNLPPNEQIFPLLSLIQENPNNTAASISLMYALRLSGSAESVHTGGRKKASPIPERIIQFWDSADIVPDVHKLMNSWRDKNPDYEYVLFNDNTAQHFLQEHFAADVLAAYLHAKEPAQKSDIFRLAYLAKEGGVYADADDFCLAGLEGLIPAEALLALYQEDHGTVGNNFIAVVPQHPIILDSLEQAVLAVNRGDTDMPWLSTGPALLTRAIARNMANSKLHCLSLFRKITILSRQAFSQRVAIHCLAAYKQTDRHWSNSTFASRAKGQNR